MSRWPAGRSDGTSSYRVKPPKRRPDERLRQLAAAGPAGEARFRFEGRGGLLSRHPARLSLHACDLLADSADWNAVTWDMTTSGAESLAAAFAYVLDQSPDGVTADALWDGDHAETTLNVTEEAFLDLVRSGRLGTKVGYNVLASRVIARR